MSLGLKRSVLSIPPEVDVDVACAAPERLKIILGPSLFDQLEAHGSIARARESLAGPTAADDGDSWVEHRKRARVGAWNKARALISDSVMLDTESREVNYTVDARWFGGCGRFLNHSCEPNLDIVSVFCDLHDVNLPRIAFFASENIKARTELTYDYGYQVCSCLCRVYALFSPTFCRVGWERGRQAARVPLRLGQVQEDSILGAC